MTAGSICIFRLGKRELREFAKKSSAFGEAFLETDPANVKVLSEVRNAPKTLKRAAPTAMIVVTVLYVLANISYV